jgi:Acetyltransferase (GNAT) domain
MVDVKFEYVKITPESDFKQLSKLMLACFNKEADLAYFKWKHFQNPAGESIAFVAMHEDLIVGSYGIIPELYSIDGVKMTFYQGVDAMTHSDYQRRGLFFKIAQKVYDNALQRYNELKLITLPAPIARDGFVKKMGHKIIKEKCSYIFVPSLLFKVTHLFLSYKNLEVLAYTSITDELSSFLNNFRPHTKNSKFFDAPIFQWKIFDNPNHDFKVVGIKKNAQLIGICVYKIDTHKSCEISYVYFLEKHDYLSYVPHLIDYIVKTTNIRYIYTWEPPKGYLADAYKKAGLRVNTFKKGPFRDTFSFIIYENMYTENQGTMVFDSYDFQPILLD